MNSDLSLKLMTFVVLSFCAVAKAVPGGEITIEVDTKTNSASNENSDAELSLQADLLAIDQSPFKKPKQQVKEFIYPYRRSFGYRIGALFDTERLRETELPLSLGGTYMFHRRKSPRLELSFNYFTDATAQLGIAHRYFFNEPNHLRPFWSYGVSLNIEPDERFATAANLDNYQGTISIGMEDVLVSSKSFRIELQLAAGLENQSAIVFLGSTWGLHP